LTALVEPGGEDADCSERIIYPLFHSFHGFSLFPSFGASPGPTTAFSGRVAALAVRQGHFSSLPFVGEAFKTGLSLLSLA